MQKISNRLCSLLLPTELTHIFRRSKAEGISGLIAGAEGEKHDNPLPQSGAAPDGRGVADRQGENDPVCEHRAKVEQRPGLFLPSGISARQRRPDDQDAGGAEDSGDDKSAAPAQQRSDAAEQEG